MPLDSLERNKINIKGLVLMEPAKQDPGLPFEPNRDIKTEAWDKLGNMQRERRNLYGSFFQAAAAVKLIAPEKLDKFNLDPEDVNTLGGFLQEFTLLGLSDRHIYTATAFKILFPVQFQEAKGSLIGADLARDEVKEYVEKEKTNFLMYSSTWTFPNIMMDLKISYPERSQDFSLDDEFYNVMQSRLESFRQEGNWKPFTTLAANMKVIFPEKARELNINEDEWEEIKALFNNLQQELIENRIDPMDFIDLCQDMMILEAEEIQITDAGVKLIMPTPPKTFTESTPQLPESRKF